MNFFHTTEGLSLDSSSRWQISGRCQERMGWAARMAAHGCGLTNFDGTLVHSLRLAALDDLQLNFGKWGWEFRNSQCR